MTSSTPLSVSEKHSDFERLSTLPACALVALGRTGSDFLQSLLDSHPEVLTFSGHIRFHSFWENSICVAAGDFDASDLLDEFIGKHIHALKSRYDLIERKHQLGEEQDQSIDIDLEQFRRYSLSLLEGEELSSRNVMLAIYGAYAQCLGQDLAKKRLIFHHTHSFDELTRYLRDFPKSKIVCMTRDPRANFVSGIEHHRDRNRFEDLDHGAHLYFTINRILNDTAPAEIYGNEYTVIRIEDLGTREYVEKVAKWLDISFDESMMRPTWAGLSWHGDALSQAGKVAGWSKKVLENGWERKLSRIDKYLMNYIMYFRLKHYGYEHKRINVWDPFIVPLLILLPLSYEFRFFSFKYLASRMRMGDYKTIAINSASYWRRVALFYKFYAGVTARRKFKHLFLSAR